MFSSLTLPSYFRWCFDLAARAAGKAGLSQTHLICACLDSRTKGLSNLPANLKAAARKAVEEAVLAFTASKVRDKRQADLDAGRKKMADGADADGTPHDNNEETNEEATGEPKMKSLARMILEAGDDEDSELK